MSGLLPKADMQCPDHSHRVKLPKHGGESVDTV